MNTPTDRPTVRVDYEDANHLVNVAVPHIKGADSFPELVLPLKTSHIAGPASAASQSRSSDSSPERLGRIALSRVRGLLSDRDLSITKSVDSYRYLSGEQITRLHFSGHATNGTAARTARSVLGRLVAGRMLRRTARRIGGVRAGSTGYVYGIGPVGHRLVHADGSRGRWDEPSGAFLEHTLAIAETAIRLIEATRSRASDDTVMGTSETSESLLGTVNAQTQLQIQTEPRCWRSYQRGLGGRETLKPDLFVVLGTAEYEDRWFIEIDLATESSTAVLKKCQTYLHYQRSGIEQERHDVFPRVLWIVQTIRRKLQIDTVIQRLKAPTGLFAVTISDEAVQFILAGGAS